MAQHVLTEARRISSAPGLLSLELDLPRIVVEIPTPAELARSTAKLVAARLAATLAAGQDAEGHSLGAPARSTLARRLADRRPPKNPRTSRYRDRYPGGPAGTGGLRGVDSGYLASRLRVAAAGGSSAEVQAPNERPIRDIEARLRATVFAATPAMLESALDAALAHTFDSWGGSGGGAAGALRKALA